MKFPRLLILLCLVLAACSLPSKTDCARPDVFCVGLVTAYGQVDDHGLNQSAWEGVQKALADGAISKADVIETIDSRDRAKNIAVFADAGYDLIVTVGFSIGDDTRSAADHWPGTRFLGVDQPQTDPRPNLTGLIFPEDQGGFLAGALAAQVTQTQKVAAVCEEQTIPEMWRYCEGFRAGVRYIAANMQPRVIYHPSHNPDDWFNDAAWGQEQAASVANSGADILFAAGGSTALGALQAAASSGIYVIGADEDMFYQVDASDFVLSSAVKQAGAGVYEAIGQARAGHLPSGDFMGKFALGPYHSFGRLVLPTVRERLAFIQRGLADGSIQTGVSPKP